MMNEMGRLKVLPQDFLVTECPSRHIGSNGSSAYLRLRKSGFTTMEAIDLVAEHLGAPRQEVGYAGLKDEDGVTEQLVSVPSETGPFPDRTVDIVDDGTRFLSVSYAGSADEPLDIGELHGNVFTVVVRDLAHETAEQLVAACAVDHHFVNYYDTQRFGVPGGPKETHLLGRALLENDLETAWELFTRSGSPEAARLHGRGDSSALAELDGRTIAFYRSSHASFVWNQLVGELVADVCPPGSTEVVADEGLRYELPTRSIHALRLAAEHPSVPFVRHRWKDGEHTTTEARRTSVVQTRVRCSPPAVDQLHPGRARCTLSFFLPSGAYATMAVRQLVRYARQPQDRAWSSEPR